MPTIKPITRLMLLYGLLALAGVALGGLVCALSDVPTVSWVRNVVAWGVGLAAASGLATLAGRRTALVLLAVAVVALAASLAGASQQGVHRWLDVGPLHINVAFLVLPAAVVALAWHRDSLLAWGSAMAILGLLVVQPDASQATAFGAAMGVIVIRAPFSAWLRAGIAGVVVALAVAGWLRPDPLESVPEVEEIIALAYAVTPALAVFAVGVIVATSLVPAVVSGKIGPTGQNAGWALSVYLLATVGTTVLGAFPMPLLGVGMSPVLGFWLGVGLLAAQLRWTVSPEPNPRIGS